MKIIRLDGVRIKVIPPDLDGDGKVGGIETLDSRKGDNLMPIKQSSDLADTLEFAFSDKFDPVEKVSDVDQKASIYEAQTPYLTVFESLCKFGFLASHHQRLPRQVKRNSNSVISKNMGRGRYSIERISGVQKEVQGKDKKEKTQIAVVGEVKK